MQSWYFSHLPLPPQQYVGALDAGGLAEASRQQIEVSDQVVRDLDIPVMRQALLLMDTVFKIADDIGVGDQVRAAVYAIRGAEYAGAVLSNFIPAGAAATAGASVFTGIGGVAAAGVLVVIGIVLFDLFSSDDEEAKHQAKLKRAQDSIQRLRQRFSLAQFASEQDDAAAQETFMVQAAATLPLFGSPSEHAKKADTAKRLAQFFRTVDKQLDKTRRDLFESLSNLARWQGALNRYAQMSQTEKDNFDSIGFGKTQPRLPHQLKAPMAAETARLKSIVNSLQGVSAPLSGAAVMLGLVAVAGAGAYAAYNPAGAMAAARVGVSGVKRVATTAGHYASSAGRYAWRALPKGR